MKPVAKKFTALILSWLLLLSAYPAVADKASAKSELELAAMELVSLSGTDKIYQLLIPHIVDQSVTILRINRPGLNEDAYRRYGEIIGVELHASLPMLYQYLAEVYTRHMSFALLSEINDFLRTPAGKRYTAANVAVSNDIAVLTSQWAFSAGEAAAQHARKQMAQEGIEL